jgi:hypothetical protein
MIDNKKDEMLSNEEKLKLKTAALRKVKATYSQLILCGMEDPHSTLMSDRSRRTIVGPTGSLLFALVRIKNSGKEARYYRQVGNKILYEDTELQKAIQEKFLAEGDLLYVSATKNPFVHRKDGSVTKLCWHHSPNHICTISLIPHTVHMQWRRDLHIKGRGGNTMYTVPEYRKV